MIRAKKYEGDRVWQKLSDMEYGETFLYEGKPYVKISGNGAFNILEAKMCILEPAEKETVFPLCDVEVGWKERMES